MSTERQKRASRANGSKSRGPVTLDDKRASSSRNAEKHDLLSGAIVLEGESTDRFLSLVAALHEELQPQTHFKESLIENIAFAPQASDAHLGHGEIGHGPRNAPPGWYVGSPA
ncbi:MAG TPA: hypothetical protein VGL82_22670 [Bryobacteraceae bacterium]|jgi:hypothetical protein